MAPFLGHDIHPLHLADAVAKVLEPPHPMGTSSWNATKKIPPAGRGRRRRARRRPPCRIGIAARRAMRRRATDRARRRCGSDDPDHRDMVPSSLQAMTDHLLKERIADLERRKAGSVQSRFGPSDRAPAREGQAARTRRRRLPARPGSFQRARPAGSPSSPCRRLGGALYRRRDHGMGHDPRPQGLRVQPGLHGVRRARSARCSPRRSTSSWTRAQGRGAGHRLERRSRRPHPGRRGLARLVRRHLLPERLGVGRRPPDLGRPRPVRRRRCVQPCDDRLHLHGARGARMFITGPDVVRTVTGEDVTPRGARRWR